MSEHKNNKLNIGQIVIPALVALFLLGGFLGLKKWPPFDWIYYGYQDTKVLITEIMQPRPTILKKQTYEGNGVTVHNVEKSFKGYTVLQGIFENGVEMRMIDMKGNTINVWPIDFFDIWPDPVHLSPEKIPNGNYNYHSQGNLILPDGSVIVNLGYLGTVKLDKCANVIWTVDRMTRHFVQNTTRGTYYIGANREIDDINDDILLFGATKSWLKNTFQRYENTVLEVNTDGEIIDEFSVLEPFFAAGLEGSLFDAAKITLDDPTHHNDIEIVTPELANKIENVNSGDLLLSIRNMHMLIILDQTTKQIKWKYSGGFTRQHDPDIMSDGTIILFNNSRAHYGFNRPLGSSLTRLDPETNEISIVAPTNENNRFYTSIFGTHQLLSNGNILVSEGLAGRAFELDSTGAVVWSFISKYDDTHASAIEDARRYSPEYFTVTDWQCPAKEN